jgi:hypothetical protein
MALDVRSVNPRITAQLAKCLVRPEQVSKVLNCPHLMDRFRVITPSAMQKLNGDDRWLQRIETDLSANPILDQSSLIIMRTQLDIIELTDSKGKVLYYGARCYSQADRVLFRQMQADYSCSFEAIALEMKGRYGIELETDTPITEMTLEIKAYYFLDQEFGLGASLQAAGVKRIVFQTAGERPFISGKDWQKTVHVPFSFLTKTNPYKIKAILVRLLTVQPNSN